MARAITLTREMWFCILWLLGDNETRCSFRTLSALHLSMGEQARLTVERKVQHPAGRFMRPEFLRRMQFWTPIVKVCMVASPPSIAGATASMRDAAMARFAEVQRYTFTKRITSDGRYVLRFSTETPYPHRRHCVQQRNGQWITYWEAYNL